MTDWAKAYNGLSAAGFTDDQIAGLAGVTRAVINSVRNGNYAFRHEPGYEGGKTVLANLTHAIDMGWIDHDPLAEPTP
jgi:hypothetical protein